MKFVAVRSVAGALTQGTLYYGSLVLVLDQSGQNLQAKVVVHDDRGYWSQWFATDFVPYKGD